MHSLAAFTTILASFILSLFVFPTAAYDYEPGDTLTRLFCYCTGDAANNDQTDWDPFTFITTTEDRRMSYIYHYTYYNHRLNQRMTLECEDHCQTYDVGAYNRNQCLIWEQLNYKCCGRFPLQVDPALGKFPLNLPQKPWSDGWSDGHPVTGHENLVYDFCYGFEGDNSGGKKRDWFGFDTARRNLPLVHDSVTPREEVEAECEKLCEEKHGLFMFRPKYGVELFNRGDFYHHFDDICTHQMDCKNGPGHVDPKHPEVTPSPDTYTREATTAFADQHTYSPYWKRTQTA
ncbi:MAG: hypothetical protein LQ349_007465 [Xanthoria aureola]|nr:MAG: hypothetical protein LQ349_007465 [Xanthoria aureola]